jgi:two-component system, NarL family, sensor histidine kinase UhpB
LKAVSLILHELNEIEQEHCRNRLPTFSILEFEQIARAINHLTETLAKAKQENSALTLHSLQIQEEEREYLAQELHDELGQSLTAIKVMAVTGKREGANVTTIHDSIISICDHLFAVVRSMMKNLHPLVLTELGLKASLEDLLAHWRQRHPEINFSCHCESALDKVDQRIGIQIFRVIQECITNTVRHADARNLTLHLNVHESGSGKTVGLAVKDDGVGCDLSAMTAGFGLLGIKARVKSLGGEVQFISTEAQGMVIQASIPVTG